MTLSMNFLLSTIEHIKNKDNRQVCFCHYIIEDHCNSCELCFSEGPNQRDMSGCYRDMIHLTR
jgi:hypothetical protein